MISAKVICDSISPLGKRLTTFQVTAHRFVLAEINTHRQLSRNYRSSRAVPVKKLLEEVRNNPAMPVYWGANKPGMQAAEELSDIIPEHPEHWMTRRSPMQCAKDEWQMAAISAANYAEQLAACGLHKQIANRVLEPFLYVHGVISATEYENFFGLRLHHMAQPEFRELAQCMWVAREASAPGLCLQGTNWHLPYFQPNDWDELHDYAHRTDNYDNFMLANGLSGSWAKDLAIKVSVARCARVSYESFDTEKRSTVEEDLKVYAKLNLPGTSEYNPLDPIHASPAEHQATPDRLVDTIVDNGGHDGFSTIQDWERPGWWGNFIGWCQYRKMLPGEAVAPLPEAYRR